jgi:xylulokinase
VELLLGIDIGTSSSKGVLATPDGDVVATAERPHRVSMPAPGHVEHDAEEVWWADFVALCQELVAHGTPAAVCVSGIGACLLPVDASGAPLRPAILYGVDTRATAEIAELRERYGDEALMARTGSVLTTQAVGPKLLWLQRREPEVWAATARFVMASSFAVLRLTGEYVLDHQSASMSDPMYDLEAFAWADDWAEEVAPGLELPRLLWPAEVAGTVTAEAAAVTGLAEGTPVAAGTIDAWSEAASVGVEAPGDCMLMYGTTMFLIAVLSEPRWHPALWGTTGAFPGTRTLSGGMATSGALTGWLRDLVGGVPFSQLVEEAAAVAAGSDGLVVLPYFAGERTPIFDPDARGAVLGLTLSHGRGHLYRALLEATAFGVRHNLEVMGDAARRLVAVGGGTRGGLWTQIVSDVTGRPQDVCGQTIGAAYGDARFAGIAAGLVDAGAEWNPVAFCVEPDSSVRDRYDELYGIYRDLYPATREHAHALAAIQRG